MMDFAAFSENALVRSAIGSMATVLLGVMVAGVSGFFAKIDKIDTIATAQVAQGKQVADMKEANDKRKDDLTEIKVNIAGFTSDHRFLIDEVRLLRSELAAARKAR